MTAPSPAPTQDEAALIRRARTGDADAFGLLMRTHHEPVFRLLHSIVRNEHDARELSQDTWVLVWQRLATFRGEAKFSTWLHAIATRRALDHLRKRRRWFDRFLPIVRGDPDATERWEAVPEPVEEGPDARRQLEQAERHEQFERILRALPPLHRTVLALREVQGLSYDEIAELMRCRPGTVMSRLFHARRLLARKLKDLPCE